jgi:hypothetical protein
MHCNGELFSVQRSIFVQIRQFPVKEDEMGLNFGMIDLPDGGKDFLLEWRGGVEGFRFIAIDFAIRIFICSEEENGRSIKLRCRDRID